MIWYVGHDTVRLTSKELYGNIRYDNDSKRIQYSDIMQHYSFVNTHINSYRKVDKKYIIMRFGLELVKKMEELYENHKRK